VPARRRKCQRLGVSTALADRLAAEHPNHDYQFDQTTDGRILKLLDVVDEHTRECLGGLVERSVTRRPAHRRTGPPGRRAGPATSVIRCDIHAECVLMEPVGPAGRVGSSVTGARPSLLR
jgi:putative transposase